MFRAMLLLVGLGCTAALAIADEDGTTKKLAAAKAEYNSKVGKHRDAVTAWLDKREDTARNAGDKKTVDQVKADRTAFTNNGELPKNAPEDLKKQLAAANADFEAALQSAIKDFTKAKKDDEAATVEMALLNFRKETLWKHVDASKTTFKDGFLQVPADSSLPTVQQFTGGFEVLLVARTELDNIRVYGPQGSFFIFNWEGKAGELRVHRPDGSNDKSGSLASSKSVPLKPNKWYTIKWRLTEEGMQLSLDGKVVFEEKKLYTLTDSSPVSVRTMKSLVDVKEFQVTPLLKK